MYGNPILSCRKRLAAIALVLGWLWLTSSGRASPGTAATVGDAQSPIIAEDFTTWDYVLPRDAALATAMAPRLGSAALAVQSGARVSGNALKWTLSGAVDAIAITRAACEPFGAVVIWVKNPRGFPLTLQLLGVAIPGGVLKWPAQDISACKNWTRLTWQSEAAVPTGPEPTERPSQQPLCSFLPICEWRIVAARLEGGGPAEIYLDEFSVEPATECPLLVHSIRPSAGQVLAGETLSVEVELEWPGRLAAISPPRICLARSDGQLVAWRYFDPERPSEGRCRASVRFAVPASLRPGEYKLLVAARGMKTDGPAAAGTNITVEQPPARPSSPMAAFPVAIADLVGRPTTDWRLSPTRVYLLPACANFDAHGLAPDVVLADGRRCWDGLDEMINALVQHDPEGRALLQVFVGATPTWLAAHPDDCAKYLPARPGLPATPRLRVLPSFSSATWRHAAAADLAELAKHIAASPWAGMILGYVISGGDGSWAMPVAHETPLPDYSPAALSAFRAWLREKYKTLPDLRTAWGQARHPVAELMKTLPPDEPRPIMAWDDATLPMPDRRLTAPTALLEPPMFQDAVDAALFAADQSAAAAIEIAHPFKLQAGAPVGVLYGGWIADSKDPVRLAASGHLGVGNLLRSPDVDFLVFEADETAAAWLAPFASAKLHDKPWIVRVVAAVNDPAQDRRSKVAAILAAGAQSIIAPPGSPQLSAAWRASEESQQQTPAKPQLAVIVDAASAAYLCPAAGLATDVLAEQMHQLDASGLRYEIWDAADVVQQKTPDARLLLFVNTYVLGQSERDLLATLRTPGRVLVFSYAAGAMRPRSGINGRDVFSLTGIPVTTLTGRGPLRVTPTPGLDPFTSQVSPGTEYGTARKVTPWFCCVDGRTEVLGKVTGTNLIGLAALRGQGWVSVYSAAPALPASLLRSLVQTAEALGEP